jgi:hypothetical protein
VNLPGWLADLADHYGSQRLARKVGRQEAVTALRDEIAVRAAIDEALRLAIFADYAARILDGYQREHLHAAPPLAVTHVQGELFPGLKKPRLYIRPGVTKPVMTMTAHDWDAAREMTLNRTKYTIKGAEADRDSFMEAYDKVRPLLKGDAPTADVEKELRGVVPLEGLAT